MLTLPMIPTLVESLLRGYARVAVTERGGYRLARLARRVQRPERWRRRFSVPSHGEPLKFDLDLGVYPDCCMAYGLYEVSVRRAILDTLRPGDHFVDAGANIGYFTLLAARAVGAVRGVGEGGRVDAFEPEPHNRRRLVEHLRINGLSDRVRVHEAALAEGAGEAVIHFLGDAGGGANHGCSTLYPGDAARGGGSGGGEAGGGEGGGGEAVPATRVATVRLDEALAGTVPTLIKMDIEGAEAAAVAGMAGLLAVDAPPVIIGEVNPTQARHAGVAAGEWVRRAVAIQPRYRVFRLGARPTSVRDLTELEAGGQANVLLRVEGRGE